MIKPNILIVDDIVNNIILLEHVLAKFDVNIIRALDASEALEKIKDTPVALALIDIRMRGMNGIELAEKIRGDDNREMVPIIFISGMALDEQELERSYINGGAVDFIMKPFKNYILRSKVNVFLELYRQKMVIAESEYMYKSILNASLDGIIIVDIDKTINSVSNLALEILGISSQEDLIGKYFHEIFPAHESEIDDLFTNSWIDGITHNKELILTKKDGVIIICEISVSLIKETNGLPKAFMASIRDISERRKIEQQMMHSERLISLGEMSSAMAHEINQPLLSIGLSIENMINKFLDQCPGDSTYLHDKAEKILGDISRISRIIDHVRAFSRESKDSPGAFKSLFCVNDSIRDAVSLVNEQFKFHLIDIKLDLDKKVPMLQGDTFKFEQVIINILTNAKDALDEKARSIKSSFTKQVKIKSWFENNKINVSIMDNGPGIPKELIDKIMLPFYTTKINGRGTGLGLSVSYGIIKELDGNIEIISDPTIGTSFIITLPVTRN